MKKLLLLLIIPLLSLGQGVEIIYGNSQVAGFTMGLGIPTKNITFYWTSLGLGRTVFTGFYDTNYSSIDDQTIITENTIGHDVDVDGMVFGVLINYNKIFPKKMQFTDELYLIFGGGYVNKYYYQTDRYEFVFNYSSNEYSLFTYEKDSSSEFIVELGLRYNLWNFHDVLTFGLESSYISNLGFSIKGSFGIRMFNP